MYNFDEVVNRFGTDSVKWDLIKTNFQTDDIIPMWVADMDFKVLPEIRQALEKRLGHEIYGYSCIGNDYLQAVVDWMKNRHHWEIASDWIVTTPGVVSALAVAVNAFTAKGDAVIIQKPVYYPFDRVIEANGRVIIENPTIFCDDHYEIDFEDFEKKISNKTKALIINNPNNPTGVIYPEESIIRLAELLSAKEKVYGHAIYLISDEPYRELAYDGAKVPFVTRYYSDAIVVYSFSKSLSLPGERIGYVAVPDKAEDAKDLTQAIVIANRVLGHVNAPSLMQRMLVRCIDEETDLNAYDRNRKLLYEGLTECGFQCVKPEGAFYLFVKSPTTDEIQFCEAAKKHNILFVPGGSFACPGYVRIAYCVSYDTIKNSLPAFRKLAEEYHLK